MAGTRAALGLVAAVGIGLAVVSGGSEADPRTPTGMPGAPPPFLGVAVAGSGGKTAAVDAYGSVVDLRAPGPAGQPLIEVSSKRQIAGTVPADTGIVARMPLGDGRAIPLWRADRLWQRYLPGTNVIRTAATLGSRRFEIVHSIRGDALGCEVDDGAAIAAESLPCRRPSGWAEAAARDDRRWASRALPLEAGAPSWARRMQVRSLLVLRALTDRRTGAVAAGARDGWAYVWPRDASAVAIALASAGYRAEARRVVRFLRGLDLAAAARFHGDGAPVDGRAAQGDAAGWLVAAERATGLAGTPASAVGPAGRPNRRPPVEPWWEATPWRGRADYQEGEGGDYVANAIASARERQPSGGRALGDFSRFRLGGLLVRAAGDPSSGVDSAVAWAVRPFPRPALFPLVRRSLRRLLAERRTRFGIVPSEHWHGGDDPWTAPTAWTAWAFAALAHHARRSSPALARRDRRTALRLVGDLRRAATPLGLLPERVDASTGLPTSTTPLAWSHAFAILALRELWP